MLNSLALSGPELWIGIIVLAIILFGGQKIPELMRGVGRGVGELQRGLEEGKKQLQAHADEIKNAAESTAETAKENQADTQPRTSS
jgi:sec-independent protein translocase protein TatA